MKSMKKYIYIYRKKRNYKLNKSQLFDIYIDNIDFPSRNITIPL